MMLKVAAKIDDQCDAHILQNPGIYREHRGSAAIELAPADTAAWNGMSAQIAAVQKPGNRATFGMFKFHDNLREINMYIIGENINSSNGRIRSALEKGDWDSLMELVCTQERAGVQAIDLNTGAMGIRETDLLLELAERTQQVTDLPLVIDSARAQTLEDAAPKCRQKGLILNSATMDDASLLPLTELAAQMGSRLVVLSLKNGSAVKAGDEMAEELKKLSERLKALNLPRNRVWVDPVVLPLAYYPDDVGELLARLEQIKAAGFSAICGLSNISFDMPRRRALNRALLPVLMGHGLDAVILDPTDRVLMDMAKAADALLSEGDGVMDYLRYLRSL